MADILERPEYCGHTVNFRTTTRSFKDKTTIHRPKEEWKVFPDTHEAIVDPETWEIVQALRRNKRRPNRTGKVSIFSGLLYCGDCGEKLYYCTSEKLDRAYFTCSSYRKNQDVCTSHYIRENVLCKLVLESLRRVLFYVQVFEKQFVQAQLERSSEEQKRALANKRRELARTEKRIGELDTLFQRIYEDSVSGRLTEERFAILSASYEDEQKRLKMDAERLRLDIERQETDTANITAFVEKAKRYTEIKELTPEIVHEFISRIVISEKRIVDGKMIHPIDIHYNAVGILDDFTPEEFEELFQKRMQRKRKTA